MAYIYINIIVIIVTCVIPEKNLNIPNRYILLTKVKDNTKTPMSSMSTCKTILLFGRFKIKEQNISPIY